jgi:hypothetical protein
MKSASFFATLFLLFVLTLQSGCEQERTLVYFDSTRYENSSAQNNSSSSFSGGTVIDTILVRDSCTWNQQIFANDRTNPCPSDQKILCWNPLTKKDTLLVTGMHNGSFVQVQLRHIDGSWHNFHGFSISDSLLFVNYFDYGELTFLNTDTMRVFLNECSLTTAQ